VSVPELIAPLLDAAGDDPVRLAALVDRLPDDVVDALVCAATAMGVWDGSLRMLPEVHERDGQGLTMEMVYRDGAAAGSGVSGPVRGHAG
jgi:hypothetical protein